MAKDFLDTIQHLPHHHSMSDSQWSLWLGSYNETNLYDFVHVTSVKDYWIKKGRVSNHTFDTIHWQ